MRHKNRGIAQLVEYRSPKPWVVGSSPSAPAKKKRMVIDHPFLFARRGQNRREPSCSQRERVAKFTVLSASREK